MYVWPGCNLVKENISLGYMFDLDVTRYEENISLGCMFGPRTNGNEIEREDLTRLGINKGRDTLERFT